MEVDMVADMEVEKVADKVADMELNMVADMVTVMAANKKNKWPTWSWTW